MRRRGTSSALTPYLNGTTIHRSTETLMMQKSALNRWIVALLLVSATGCMGGPRQRPVKGGPVDQGPESIVAERKFLEGRWSLMQFQVFPQGKPPITLTGDGSLNYDEFGNL